MMLLILCSFSPSTEPPLRTSSHDNTESAPPLPLPAQAAESTNPRARPGRALLPEAQNAPAMTINTPGAVAAPQSDSRTGELPALGALPQPLSQGSFPSAASTAPSAAPQHREQLQQLIQPPELPLTTPGGKHRDLPFCNTSRNDSCHE